MYADSEMPHGTPRSPVFDLARDDRPVGLVEQRLGIVAHDESGIRYSNIVAVHEMSARPTPSTGVSCRPRRNQCSCGASPFAMAMKTGEPRLRRQQVVERIIAAPSETL